MKKLILITIVLIAILLSFNQIPSDIYALDTSCPMAVNPQRVIPGGNFTITAWVHNNNTNGTFNIYIIPPGAQSPQQVAPFKSGISPSGISENDETGQKYKDHKFMTFGPYTIEGILSSNKAYTVKITGPSGLTGPILVPCNQELFVQDDTPPIPDNTSPGTVTAILERPKGTSEINAGEEVLVCGDYAPPNSAFRAEGRDVFLLIDGQQMSRNTVTDSNGKYCITSDPVNSYDKSKVLTDHEIRVSVAGGGSSNATSAPLTVRVLNPEKASRVELTVTSQVIKGKKLSFSIKTLRYDNSQDKIVVAPNSIVGIYLERAGGDLGEIVRLTTNSSGESSWNEKTTDELGLELNTTYTLHAIATINGVRRDNQKPFVVENLQSVPAPENPQLDCSKEPEKCSSSTGQSCDPNNFEWTTNKDGKRIPKFGSGVMTAIGCIPTDPKDLITKLMGFSAGIGGGIALLLMILGAFQMMTSAGNPEAIKKGRDQFIAAAIGLVFVILSATLLRIVGFDILNIPGFG